MYASGSCSMTVEAACDEHNFLWKASVTPMLLLRWAMMDWGAISENDLVSMMIAPVENGASTTLALRKSIKIYAV